jgi:cystathionine gamma-synthase
LARVYGRMDTPAWTALEETLGKLEGAEVAVYSSGMSACFSLLLALASDRKKVIIGADGYYNTRKLVQSLRAFGLESTFVDMADLAAIEAELGRGPAILWAETPANPLLRVYDLGQLGALARRFSAPLVVDNTLATGWLQQPLEWGATASITSLTKAASGHSDLLLGAVATRDPQLMALLREWRTLGGGIASPFDSWLALRSLKTLPLRIVRQSESAQTIALRLQKTSHVRVVHYPGLDPATREIAIRQMPRGFGPMLSLEIDGTDVQADSVVSAAQLIIPATSFGGVESSWERRKRWASETAPSSLIRLSVGVEPVEDILADIEHSFEVLD